MPWQYSKKITGLWTNYQNVNAWAYISGLGWRKLTNPDDDVTTAMFVACAEAKGDDRYVNFLEESRSGNMEIREIYVW
jgi:hypothetical protein